MIQEANLSNRGRYAVLTMIEIATTQSPLALHVISDRINVSKSYLEQLASPLRQHGLIDAVKGPHGGYVLARDATKITIADIVAAADDWSPGQRKQATTFLPPNDPSQWLWKQINQAMTAHLRTITLRDVIHSSLKE